MPSPYREPALPEPAPPRRPTPEEEMRLILLNSNCHDASRPLGIAMALLYPLALPSFVYIFAERWRYERKLRAANVAVPPR